MFIDPFGSLRADLAKSLIDAWLKLRKSKAEEELKTEEWKALEREYMEHLRWRFRYPKQAFGQQLMYSWLLTLLVIALVVSGLVFSFIQLNAAIKLGDLSSLSTEIAVQTAGKLSMNSSIVGAVVLVISLLFFNLYLKHVFQIQHPMPPHVALSETDAGKIWKQLKDKLSGRYKGTEKKGVDQTKDSQPSLPPEGEDAAAEG